MTTFYHKILFIGLVISVLQANSQISVGNLNNMTTGTKSVQFVQFSMPFGNEFHRIDSIDFNNDGQFDVLFEVNISYFNDNKGGYMVMTSLHQGFEFRFDNLYEVDRLSTGDVIAPADKWSGGNGLILSKAEAMGNYQEYGEWVDVSDGYAGFRMMMGQDTFYGWMRIQATINVDQAGCFFKVFSGWAIQSVPNNNVNNNPPGNFIIAGDSSGLVSGNQFIKLTQGPIPFGGLGGTYDSLDLNRDGMFDVIFYPYICNGFDCNLSSTYMAGLHNNFTFVNGNGIYNPRRLDEGDTIAVSASWNDLGFYHVGELISSGFGWNGWQTSGEWWNNYLGYAGFRLITPNNDTLLGWIHIYTYSLASDGAYIEVDAWAIQPDPSQKPFVAISAVPGKAVYCPGDTVALNAHTAGADQMEWHIWDETTDTSDIITVILPDTSVVVSLTAGNAIGDTTISVVLEVSPLEITVSPVVLTCAQTSVPLSASTNIPAEIRWVIDSDTLPAGIPPVIEVGMVSFFAFAEDEYGCVAASQPVEIQTDTDLPTVSVIFQEDEHLLIAQSSTPGVVFEWIFNGQTTFGDSIFVTEPGFYSVIATNISNGCTAVSGINVELTGTSAVDAGTVGMLPNPFDDFLWIENKSLQEIKGYIIDISGKPVLEGISIAPSGNLRVSTKELPAGVYFFVGRQGQSMIYKKVVK